jgi:hypothetical protein
VAGIALAKTYEGARTYLLGGGVIYLALFAYGAIWGADEGSANFIPMNSQVRGKGGNSRPSTFQRSRRPTRSWPR